LLSSPFSNQDTRRYPPKLKKEWSRGVEEESIRGKGGSETLKSENDKTKKSENAENLSHLTTAPCEGMSGFCLRMVLKMRVELWQGNESNEKQKMKEKGFGIR